MTLIQAIRRAFDERNLRMGAAIVDRLWLKHGLTYNQVEAMAAKAGIDKADWAEFMTEADSHF